MESAAVRRSRPLQASLGQFEVSANSWRFGGHILRERPSRMALDFAVPFGLAALGYLLAELHDFINIGLLAWEA